MTFIPQVPILLNCRWHEKVNITCRIFHMYMKHYGLNGLSYTPGPGTIIECVIYLLRYGKRTYYLHYLLRAAEQLKKRKKKDKIPTTQRYRFLMIASLHKRQLNPGAKELLEEFFIHGYCNIFYQVFEPYIRHKNEKNTWC